MTLALTTRTGLTWIVPHHPHGVGVGLKPALPAAVASRRPPTPPDAVSHSVSFGSHSVSLDSHSVSFVSGTCLASQS